MQYVAEDNSDKIRLRAVPWLDVVSVSAVEILLVSDGEVDLTRRASGQQEQGCEVTFNNTRMEREEKIKPNESPAMGFRQ